MSICDRAPSSWCGDGHLVVQSYFCLSCLGPPTPHPPWSTTWQYMAQWLDASLGEHDPTPWSNWYRTIALALLLVLFQDICKNPKLIVDGVSGNDLNQGKLANCWYIASCSALAQKEEVWQKVKAGQFLFPDQVRGFQPTPSQTAVDSLVILCKHIFRKAAGQARNQF